MLIYTCLLNLSTDLTSYYLFLNSRNKTSLFEKYTFTSTNIFILIIWISLISLVLYMIINSMKLDFSKYGLFYIIRLGRSKYLYIKLLSVIFVLCNICLITILQEFITFRILGIYLNYITYFQIYIYYLLLLFCLSILSMTIYLFTRNPDVAFLLIILFASFIKLLINNVSRTTISKYIGRLSINSKLIYSIDLNFYCYISIVCIVSFSIIFFLKMQIVDLSLQKIKE